MMYKHLARPFLFKMDPENAHHMTISGLRTASRIPGVLAAVRMGCAMSDPALAVSCLGLTFPNPIGLAAGLDKNAEAVAGFAAMGFGFIEVGTVTPKPQPGNERPRMFRLPPDKALINRMGFNNAGAEAMAAELGKRRPIAGKLAVNIGKNKWTPNDEAASDYVSCLRTLYGHGDFFVVNISSPNTPDLRKLQFGDDLHRLLSAVKGEAERLAGAGPRKPIVVKIAPDMKDEELPVMMQAIAASGIDGVIATNTTVERKGLSHPNAKESGGLSGKPLMARSTQMVREIYRLTEGKLPIIASGGVFDGRDAYEKIRAGATLVEIYTALIYEGPTLVKRLNRSLRDLLAYDGFTHVSDAVGVDA